MGRAETLRQEQSQVEQHETAKAMALSQNTYYSNGLTSTLRVDCSAAMSQIKHGMFSTKQQIVHHTTELEWRDQIVDGGL